MTERAPQVLVLGAGGQVGRELTSASSPFLAVRGIGHRQLDITRASRVQRAVEALAPAAVINVAAWTDVDGAEDHVDEAYRVNRDGAVFVAAACAGRNIPLIHVSTDYVFGGNGWRPYVETDPTGPVNVYGASKLAGERRVLEEHPAAVVLRTSAVYGTHGSNFVRAILAEAAQREELRIVSDQRTCPTAARHLAATLLTLAARMAQDPTAVPAGVLHWADAGEASWLELATVAIEEARRQSILKVSRIIPVTSEAWSARARRPRYSVLDCRRAESLGLARTPWREGVCRVVRALVERAA